MKRMRTVHLKTNMGRGREKEINMNTTKIRSINRRTERRRINEDHKMKKKNKEHNK